MLSSLISEIPNVIFRPRKEIQIPPSAINDGVFLIPSAKYYYGNKMPVPNTIGTENDKLLSLQIWYSMKSDDIFPLLTVYTKSRSDQIGETGSTRPASQVALSMKSQLRQYPDREDWFYYPGFDLILGQMKGMTIEQFIDDFYRFPLNPKSDSFMVARLLEHYVTTGHEHDLRKYLEDRDVIYLQNHSFNFYPLYQLFFLLTRFYTYPFSESQFQLAKRRYSTEWNSPERVFIDSIFNYEIYNLPQILDIIDQITTQGPESVGKIFKTNNLDWVKWSNEYLLNMNKEPQNIDNLGNVNYIVAEKLFDFTDNDIEELCKNFNLVMPFTSEFPTRYSYIQDIASKIQRFKANPFNVILWNKQIVESNKF
jgi:hypothetical protein